MTPTPVRLTVEWWVRPEQGRGVVSELQALMTKTRRDVGCVSCALETDVGELVRVKLRQEWATEQDLRRFVRSQQFVTLAILMESAKESPALQFELPGRTRGLEWAHEVRQEATA